MAEVIDVYKIDGEFEDPLSPPSSVLPPIKTYSRARKSKDLEEDCADYEEIDITLPKRGRPSKKKKLSQNPPKNEEKIDEENNPPAADESEISPEPAKRKRGRPKKEQKESNDVLNSELDASLTLKNAELPRRSSLRKRPEPVKEKEIVVEKVSKGKGKSVEAVKNNSPNEVVDVTPVVGKTTSEYSCDTCPRIFKTMQGVKIHAASCKKLSAIIKPYVKQELEDTPGNNVSNRLEARNNSEISPKSVGDGGQDSNDGYPGPLTTDIVDYEVEAGKCHCCGEDLETAHSNGEFQCADCLKLFKLKSSLERHRRVIHNEGETFQCPECNARCPDKGTLARHMYTHTGLKPYSCPVCKKEFSRKYHLVRHNNQTGCDGSERPAFPCQVCGRVFNRKDNLREHLRAHAGQTKRKKKYNCEYCGKEFLGSTLLHIHKRSHTGEKPYSCDFCGRKFPSSGAMKKHRRKHTGERPYECKQCFARFAAKETLNRHMRTHTGIKPHSCQYCGKSFIQASQLRAHIFHHSGENGFTCDQCGKAFNRRTRLQLHVKYVHEGAIPFTCETCNKTFVRKEDLARHHILHSGIKAHKCPICEKCFAMKSSLKIHLLTHTKEPPRSCDECGRAFIRQDCLLRHMRTKHRDMLEEIMAEAEKKKLQQQLLAAANEAALELPDPDEPKVLTEQGLADAIRELLTLLVDETTLKAFGFPDAPVDRLLEAVIRRCGHQPAAFSEMDYGDRLRENAKLLFTVVIDDSAVKTLLNNQTVDEVILHVLRLAKS